MTEDQIPQQTLTRIKQIRTLATLGKKKHYNAADRKQRYHDRLGAAVITINVVLGSGFLAMLGTQISDLIKWMGAALSLIAALGAAYQKFFGFQRAVTGHRDIARRYLVVAHECQNLLGDFQDGQIAAVQLGKRRDAIQKTLSRIDADAESFPPSPQDYELAKAGMANGEETYTEADLQLGENPS